MYRMGRWNKWVHFVWYTIHLPRWNCMHNNYWYTPPLPPPLNSCLYRACLDFLILSFLARAEIKINKTHSNGKKEGGGARRKRAKWLLLLNYITKCTKCTGEWEWVQRGYPCYLVRYIFATRRRLLHVARKQKAHNTHTHTSVCGACIGCICMCNFVLGTWVFIHCSLAWPPVFMANSPTKPATCDVAVNTCTHYIRVYMCVQFNTHTHTQPGAQSRIHK